MPAGDRQGDVGTILIGEGDSACLGVHRLHRHVEHAAGDRRDRQERRIGRLPLAAERWQHHGHDVVVARRSTQQHLVEAAGLVVFRGAGELVVEAEGVEETAQHGVVVVAKARIVAAERIGHGRQRHLHIGLERGTVRDILRNLAHAVHVIGKAQQPGGDFVAGQQAEGGADHGGARHLAEGADMRQPRGAVAGLEQYRTLAGCA